MAFDLRKLLGLVNNSPHPQPHAAAQAPARTSQPVQPPFHPQVAAQFQMQPQGQPEDAGLVNGPQGFAPLNSDVAHFPTSQVQSNVNGYAQPFGYNSLQGSGRQFQPSWDNPEDIYRSNGY